MNFAPAFFEASTLTAATEGWRMTFPSVHFLLFLPVVVGAYFAFPPRFRRAWLLVASYYFYFFAAPDYLWVLLAGTVFSYVMAQFISKSTGARGRGALLGVGIAGLLLTLCFFKYNAAFASFLSPLLQNSAFSFPENYFVTAKALGISFYTFTSIGYLIDVHSNTVPAEKNLLTHALFLGFFPYVTMGPISRAKSMLPQLKDTARRFNAQNARSGLLLMAVGFFKKMAVADTLAVFVSAIYSEQLPSYSGLTLLAANFAFMLQLYFDFSGYTDIARGTAQMLGIHLPQNFNTPYFSTNFSAFWSRWHISLSSWLQDYIFTPLVWSRWPEKLPLLGKYVKKPPIISSITAVFLISGIWHGDSMCFLLWGALQAIFRIGEELLHRFFGKPKKNPPLRVRVCKTAVVLVLWMQSLVFFKVGGMKNSSISLALGALVGQFKSFSPATLWTDLFGAVYNNVYNHEVITYAFLAFMLLCTTLAVWGDWLQFARLKGKALSEGISTLPKTRRWAIYYLLVLCCFAAFLAQSGGFAGTSFLYGGY